MRRNTSSAKQFKVGIVLPQRQIKSIEIEKYSMYTVREPEKILFLMENITKRSYIWLLVEINSEGYLLANMSFNLNTQISDILFFTIEKYAKI